ncbi:hypothetical protein D3C77_498720 [compost metagenome]
MCKTLRNEVRSWANLQAGADYFDELLAGFNVDQWRVTRPVRVIASQIRHRRMHVLKCPQFRQHNRREARAQKNRLDGRLICAVPNGRSELRRTETDDKSIITYDSFAAQWPCVTLRSDHR